MASETADDPVEVEVEVKEVMGERGQMIGGVRAQEDC